MRLERVLILGGTRLAREAADALHARSVATLTSFSGVTAAPLMPAGEIRSGGFGGPAGLEAFLRQNCFDVVIDATHAFAAQMSAHAVQACAASGVRLLRLEAPPWVPQAGDDWRHVADSAAAVAALPPGARVAVTVGRKEIDRFFARSDLSGLARMIEPPEVVVPSFWSVMLERPPFTLEREIEVLRGHDVSMLVSKNAGGPRASKLDAAAALGLPVIMVERPAQPPAETVPSIADLLGRLGLRV